MRAGRQSTATRSVESVAFDLPVGEGARLLAKPGGADVKAETDEELAASLVAEMLRTGLAAKG